MTTKFLDTKICTFKIILSWRSPRKKQRFGRFSSLPPNPPPPSQSENYIFIVVSPSLNNIISDDIKFALSKFYRLWEFQGATRLGATGLRGSEREICL